MRPALVLTSGLVGALIAVGAAGAAVKSISLTTPVVAGSYASLTVNVLPRARCTGQVSYEPNAIRLGPGTGGRISWRWRVAADTKPGSWPLVVSCGKSGTLRTRITILAATPEVPLADAAKAV